VNVGQLMFAVAVMMLTSIVAIGVAKKLNIGAIVALLLVGLALGPHSPRPLLTGHIGELRAVGEIGIMLLLFAVGLGTVPAQLWSMRRLVFGLGSAQYAFTTAAIGAFLFATVGDASAHWHSVLVVSLALAMSSSAIPISILQAQGDSASTQGRAVIAIDIFQSLMAIPVLALIPVLGMASGPGAHGLDIEKVSAVVAAIAGVYVLGRFILPWALGLAARHLGPGGFALTVLAAVFLAGGWMDSVGISIALGAFMIGVLLSTTVYADQIKAAVAPAKQVLLALFFIAIGMAIDPRELVEFKADLLLYVPGLLLIKFIVLFALARFFQLESRSALLAGLLAMPFDELAYVVMASAKANSLLDARYYSVGLVVVSLSFAVSPMLINLGYKWSDRLRHQRVKTAPDPDARIAEDAVVVAGYGYVGRVVCAILGRAHIPYRAFELDPERLEKGRQSSHNVQYGDATDMRMMEAIGIRNARLVVVTTGHYESTRRMVGNLRHFFPRVPVMAAVPYLAQRDELRELGAARVMALMPEGTLKFGRSILDRLGMAIERADSIIRALKANDYAALRTAGAAEQN